MALTHECPAPGCTIRCRYNQLACYTHWRKIPKALRDEINRAWYGGDTRAHVEARKACVTFLEENPD